MTISIRLTEAEEERLGNLARRTGRTKSFYVRRALREDLADLEDAVVAGATLDTFKADGPRSRPLAALEAEIDA